VIGNLINNAVLHGFEGRAQGTISITGEPGQAASVILRVADNGQGIPADMVGRIFDPFVTTKKGRGGTGLGLHISYNAVVNLLGGSLTVHSVEGEGATFVLRLPMTAPNVGATIV
jgi:signal transduction histidine kinase